MCFCVFFGIISGPGQDVLIFMPEKVAQKGSLRGSRGHHFGTFFSRCFANCWRVLFGHAFRHVSKLILACILKDLGHIFVSFLKVLESSSGKSETLEFDDRFTKFDDFS